MKIQKLLKEKRRFFLIFTILFLLIILNISNKMCSKTIILNSKEYLTSYQYTHYYSGDATGSGNCTGSGKCTKDFTTDGQGWYYYNHNGKQYLVVAAALQTCRDSSDHCGVNVSKHGIATNIQYYNYYDTLILPINGKNYDAIVLDACGACMWGRQDSRGTELFDIFIRNSSLTTPDNTIKDQPTETSKDKENIEHYSTSYGGDIKDGWMYNRQKIIEKWREFEMEIDEKNIDDSIDEIFRRAKLSYEAYVEEYGDPDTNHSGPSAGYSVKDCEEMAGETNYGDYTTWKQGYDLWQNIKIGSDTLGQSGCLVTSIAIQLKAMGVDAGIENFNPGTFACYLSKNGKFTSDGSLYGDWSNIVSGVNVTGGTVKGTKEEQAQQMQTLINGGCHLVIYAPHGGSSHFVAVSGTTSNNIKIIDPGAGKTQLWGNIYDYNNVTGYRCLKAS